ncbi:MAG TPA: L,D-transpeptidase [Bacteroidales bacterium]|nr:L,D-transpeptidase [Bacteroidales bacterium]
MKKLLNPRLYIFLLLALVILGMIFSPEIANFGARLSNIGGRNHATSKPENLDALKAATEKKILSIQQSLDKLVPRTPYMVINTTENRFELYKDSKKVREGFCSTGSLIKLRTESDKQWIFKTPKGRFSIQSKITSPVWVKPDWVFVEEGLPIPPPNHPSRYESGVLGDYALSLGKGYLIHGTLYQRLLGMPVTHGCVRLGDDDLEVVYSTLSIGSKVFIY